jgi:DNA-binding NarL/FixJ family response regulator
MIAMRFLELRRELWSIDGEERIPILTLEADAEGYLGDGASEAAVLDVVERVMRRHAAAGKSEISSLRFFRNSVRDAMAQAKPGTNSSTNGHAPADTPPHRVLLWQGRLATWLESGTWDKGWSIHDCPTAVVNEYRDRLKLKPPPGTSVARETPDGDAA